MKYLYYILSTLVLGSCSKDIQLTPGLEDFHVSLKSDTYRVGEEVEFLMEGNPDLVTFYSGELYNQYEFKDGRILSIDDAILSFTSARTSGTRQADQLRVLVSNDFNGNYSDFASMQSAQWHDITERVNLAVNITFTSSGNIDISEFMVQGKPLYVAFRYIARSQAEFGHWQIWNIQSFSLLGNTVAGVLTLGDMSDSDFQFVEEKPDTAPSRSTKTATRVALNAPETNTDESLLPVEVWAVSRPFDVDNIDRGPDLPVAIKGNVDPRKTVHTHIYSEPGTYKVHFVATNANVQHAEQVVREIEVTITQ